MFRIRKTKMFRIRKIRFKSIAERHSKRILFGLANELFKRLIISSDNSYYNLPFVHSWHRSKKEEEKWITKQKLYEFENIEHQKFPKQIVDILLSLLNGRVKPTDKIYDIGCNSGYYLSKIYEHGFENLCGSDPQKSAIEYIKENRPYITPVHGHFGDAETMLAYPVITHTHYM